MKSSEAIIGTLVKIENQYATIHAVRDYGIVVKYLISKHKGIAKYHEAKLVQAEELFELAWKVE